MAAIVGLALGILATSLQAHENFTVPALTVLMLGFSLLIDNDILRRIMHFIGVMLCWTCVAHNFGGVFGDFMEHYYKNEAGWWFGTCFFHILGIVIPIDDFFQRGSNQPPTRKVFLVP